MIMEQRDMKIPSELIPKCPFCGAPMTMNLRQDDLFVQDEGWYAAAGDTPAIIKYPFWNMTASNPKAVYACVNYGEAVCPQAIEKQSVCMNEDIGEVICDMMK